MSKQEGVYSSRNEHSILELFSSQWKKYQDNLMAALVTLTPEQLQLRPKANLLSVGELAQHIIAVRVYWFHGLLGEGGPEIAGFALWDEPGAPERTAAELVEGLDLSWKLMAEALARWSAADMQQTFLYHFEQRSSEVSRTWVVWHVLEQNLHHGGELAVTLNLYGLEAPDL